MFLQFQLQSWPTPQIFVKGGSGVIPPDMKTFASSLITLDGISTSYSAAHGFGSEPSIIHARLICVNNDGDSLYTIGNQLDAICCILTSQDAIPIAVGCNTTNIYIDLAEPLVGNEGDYQIIQLGGANQGQVTSFNNFKLQFFAIQF